MITHRLLIVFIDFIDEIFLARDSLDSHYLACHAMLREDHCVTSQIIAALESTAVYMFVVSQYTCSFYVLIHAFLF